MQFNKAIRIAGPLRRPLRNFILNRRLKFPKLISLELTNACNARCIMCPRDQLNRKIGTIGMDVVKKLCTDASGKPLGKINMFGFGESLLHPRLIDIIGYVKKALPEVELNLSTNAQILDDKLAIGLLESGIDRINIDIDGVTRRTYENIRRQLDFERVNNNTRHLIQARNKLHSRVKISVTIIDMDITHGEIPAFKRTWTHLADTVYVNHYNTWIGIFPDRNTHEAGMGNSAFPCKNPWKEMVVNYDGSVAFCCMDFNSTIVLGNVMKQTVEQIWRGEEMERLRRMHLEGRYEEIPICSKCNEFIFQSDSFWANLFYR
ncbi:MAG: SPASM domain-containing protein [Deltaproteobacteria bacterium]|nr:SPASM domain-containing protein [Deltaproteobacteria bacterium]